MTTDDSRTGLCDTCQHARRIASGRGSAFLLCLRSKDDPHYPKYPRLPVVQCAGYDRRVDIDQLETNAP